MSKNSGGIARSRHPSVSDTKKIQTRRQEQLLVARRLCASCLQHLGSNQRDETRLTSIQVS